MTDEGLLVILKRRRIKTDAMLEEWSCFFFIWRCLPTTTTLIQFGDYAVLAKLGVKTE